MSGRTMRAAVLHAPGDLRVERVPVPTLGPADALVRVAACGICGSDVPRVLTTGTYHFPTIPGHEMAGVVEELGPEAAAAGPGGARRHAGRRDPPRSLPATAGSARSAPSPSARRTTTSVRGRTADSRNTCAPPRRTWCRFPRGCPSSRAPCWSPPRWRCTPCATSASPGARASGCSASGRSATSSPSGPVRSAPGASSPSTSRRGSSRSRARSGSRMPLDAGAPRRGRDPPRADRRRRASTRRSTPPARPAALRAGHRLARPVRPSRPRRPPAPTG